MSTHLVDNLKFLLLRFGVFSWSHKLNIGTIATVANDAVGKLLLESSESFHQHKGYFQGAFQTAIMCIEAEHANEG